MTPLYVAVDGGARETLLPPALAGGHALADVTRESCADDSHWRCLFKESAPDLLVVGTSDSGHGRTIEAAARRAARAAAVPIVAIEDFPGNYPGVSGGEANLVIVESAPAHDLYLRRLASRAAPVEVRSPARYDGYRARVDDIRRATREEWRQRHASRVLWAGQPETQDSLSTLEALMPVLQAHRVELVFKAHPRDSGYASGIYQELLESAGVPFGDATSVSIVDALDTAPRLVVTQFSSVAIEAGFYGIPSLCVLLPEAGGARLREKKGYAAPLFCMAGAAALATDVRETEPLFAQALSDGSFRDGLTRAFDGYFEVRELQTPALLERLERFVAERK